MVPAKYVTYNSDTDECFVVFGDDVADTTLIGIGRQLNMLPGVSATAAMTQLSKDGPEEKTVRITTHRGQADAVSAKVKEFVQLELPYSVRELKLTLAFCGCGAHNNAYSTMAFVVGYEPPEIGLFMHDALQAIKTEMPTYLPLLPHDATKFPEEVGRRVDALLRSKGAFVVDIYIRTEPAPCPGVPNFVQQNPN